MFFGVSNASTVQPIISSFQLRELFSSGNSSTGWIIYNSMFILRGPRGDISWSILKGTASELTWFFFLFIFLISMIQESFVFIIALLCHVSRTFQMTWQDVSNLFRCNSCMWIILVFFIKVNIHNVKNQYRLQQKKKNQVNSRQPINLQFKI